MTNINALELDGSNLKKKLKIALMFENQQKIELLSKLYHMEENTASDRLFLKSLKSKLKAKF